MMVGGVAGCCSAQLAYYVDDVVAADVQHLGGYGIIAITNTAQEEYGAGARLEAVGFEAVARWKSSHRDGTHCTLWFRATPDMKVPLPQPGIVALAKRIAKMSARKGKRKVAKARKAAGRGA